MVSAAPSPAIAVPPAPIPSQAAAAQSDSSVPSAPSDPSPCLPPISAADRPLLLRLLALKEDYQALANELMANACTAPPGHPKDLLDLYQWAERPHIAAWLAHHRALTDLQRRTLALDTLEKVIKECPTPLERRRAATTILRALDHNWPSWNRSRERSTGPPPSPRWRPDRQQDRLAAFRGQPGEGCDAPPSPPPPVPNTSSAAPLSPRAAMPSAPSPSRAPRPPSTPAPIDNPRAATIAIARTLEIPQPPRALAALHAHCAPNATIAGHPASPDAATFIAALPKSFPAAFRLPLATLYVSDTIPRERTDTRAKFKLTLQTRSKDIFLCTAIVTRAGPTHPWLLSDLTILRRDSG